jgi:hypothetical protein
MPLAPASAAAWMPSQVAAILISTRSIVDALGLVQLDDALGPRQVALASKLSRASTSVDTRPE